jgi:hypothetical protein
MKKWNMMLMVAFIALLIPMSPTMVNAQNEATLSISKSADRTLASVGDNITYTYTISNSNNVTMTKAEILKLSGILGKGIEKAPGLQKLFNLKSQAAEQSGKKNRDKKEEQLRIRQMTENHGATKGQLKIRQRVENNVGTGL